MNGVSRGKAVDGGVGGAQDDARSFDKGVISVVEKRLFLSLKMLFLLKKYCFWCCKYTGNYVYRR